MPLLQNRWGKAHAFTFSYGLDTFYLLLQFRAQPFSALSRRLAALLALTTHSLASWYHTELASESVEGCQRARETGGNDASDFPLQDCSKTQFVDQKSNHSFSRSWELHASPPLAWLTRGERRAEFLQMTPPFLVNFLTSPAFLNYSILAAFWFLKDPHTDALES